jgi:uncharacterized protein YjlB
LISDCLAYKCTKQALFRFSGRQKIKGTAGDIIIIPVGVGHKDLGSENLRVVDAYPKGRSWDMNCGLPGERPRADKNIAVLPFPEADPQPGMNAGLAKIWQPI